MAFSPLKTAPGAPSVPPLHAHKKDKAKKAPIPAPRKASGRTSAYSIFDEDSKALETAKGELAEEPATLYRESHATHSVAKEVEEKEEEEEKEDEYLLACFDSFSGFMYMYLTPLGHVKVS